VRLAKRPACEAIVAKKMAIAAKVKEYSNGVNP
jgi:hypothetical protein